MANTPLPPNPLLGRRTVLKGLLGASALAAVPSLAACGSGGSAGDGKTVGFGSNYSEPAPREAITAVMETFKQQSGLEVKINTKEHDTFQQQINNYLQGKPDDVWSW